MTTRTSHQQRTVEAIVESDRRAAVASAEATVIATSCELAPFSYAALRALKGTPALGEALAGLADELVRPQVIRFLVERRAATGALWGWGDVDAVEAAFRRLIATTRAEQLARRIGAAQAAKIAEMLKGETMETTNEEPACRPDGEPGAWTWRAPVAALDICPKCQQPRDAFGRCGCDYQLTPTATQIEAALLRIETDAARRARHARDAGDAEGEKLAARVAQACRDAAALALAGAYTVTSTGDLLVKSPRGMWHRVGRRPAEGDGYSPVVCSCEWGTKSNHVGPCKHEQLWEGYYAAADEAVALADDSADAARWAA